MQPKRIVAARKMVLSMNFPSLGPTVWSVFAGDRCDDEWCRCWFGFTSLSSSSDRFLSTEHSSPTARAVKVNNDHTNRLKSNAIANVSQSSVFHVELPVLLFTVRVFITCISSTSYYSEYVFRNHGVCSWLARLERNCNRLQLVSIGE